MKKIESVDKNKLREKIVAFAKKFVGTPYQYGAKVTKSPKTFDCSSFVQFVYNHFGYQIPRSTILQAEFIKKTVKDISQIELADLIYLHGKRGYYTPKYPQGIGHVVMYIGNNQVIHASGSGKRKEVKIENLKKVIKRRGPLVVIKRIV